MENFRNDHDVHKNFKDSGNIVNQVKGNNKGKMRNYR